MSDVKIIGFTGPKGTGKDAAADVLVRELGWEKINPGDPIRAMVRALLEHDGYTPADALTMVTDPVAREQAVWTLPGGPTPRRLMQLLGDDWGRDLVHPYFWAGQMERTALYLLEYGAPGVAITGVRKPNEADAIRGLGGEIWRVDRPGFEATGEHSSERGFEAIEADLTINNDGDLADLDRGLFKVALRRHLAGMKAHFSGAVFPGVTFADLGGESEPLRSFDPNYMWLAHEDALASEPGDA